MFPTTLVSRVLSVIIFTVSHLPPLPLSFTGARGAHKRHHGNIYSYHRVQNSYQLFKTPWFDTNVVFYYFYMPPFQPSSISQLRVGNSFSISSPFDITKLQKKLSWCQIDWKFSILSVNGHVYSYPLPPLWRLDLNYIERVIIHLSVPENYSFDAIISEYFYRPSFLYGC